MSLAQQNMSAGRAWRSAATVYMSLAQQNMSAGRAWRSAATVFLASSNICTCPLLTISKTSASLSSGRPRATQPPPPSEAPLLLRHSLAEPGEIRWESMVPYFNASRPTLCRTNACSRQTLRHESWMEQRGNSGTTAGQQQDNSETTA